MKNVINRVKRVRFLQLLAEFMPMREIGKTLKKSRPALYKMRARLVCDGLLNTDFSFTSAGLQAMEKDALLLQNVTRKNVIRLHNAAVVVGLAGKPLNWDERREHWQVQKGGNRWMLASGLFTEVRVTDVLRVRTTPSSVIIYFGEIWADDPTEAKNALFKLALPAIALVEKELKVRLHRQGTFKFRTAQQHHALVKNQLAVELCKAGFKVQVQDMQGRVRVVVDESLGFGELETPNAIFGEGDALSLKGLFEDVTVFGLSLRENNSRLEALERTVYVEARRGERKDRPELR